MGRGESEGILKYRLIFETFLLQEAFSDCSNSSSQQSKNLCTIFFGLVLSEDFYMCINCALVVIYLFMHQSPSRVHQEHFILSCVHRDKYIQQILGELTTKFAQLRFTVILYFNKYDK